MIKRYMKKPVVVEAMQLDWGTTLQEFLRAPTDGEWYDEVIKEGWAGPDGSSCSTDKIHGILIGMTSRQWFFADLPANLHDWRYQRIRRLGLSEIHRKAADLGYYVDCLERCRGLTGWKWWSARRRCKYRYMVLRLAAAYAAKGPHHRLKLGGFGEKQKRT